MITVTIPKNNSEFPLLYFIISRPRALDFFSIINDQKECFFFLKLSIYCVSVILFVKALNLSNKKQFRSKKFVPFEIIISIDPKLPENIFYQEILDTKLFSVVITKDKFVALESIIEYFKRILKEKQNEILKKA